MDYDDDDTSIGESGFDTFDVTASGPGKGKRAAYSVEYQALSKQDLAHEMKREIDHVSGALGLNVSPDGTIVIERLLLMDVHA